MSHYPSSEDRRASLALAMSRADDLWEAAESDAPTVVAMWAALCGAQVTVTYGGSGYDRGYRVGCEACGELYDMSWGMDEIPNKYAQEHAEKCRRVPARLWPTEGGVR